MTTETVERKILVELRFPAALELLNAAIERRERQATWVDRMDAMDAVVDRKYLARIREAEAALREALAIPVESAEDG